MAISASEIIELRGKSREFVDQHVLRGFVDRHVLCEFVDRHVLAENSLMIFYYYL